MVQVPIIDFINEYMKKNKNNKEAKEILGITNYISRLNGIKYNYEIDKNELKVAGAQTALFFF